MHILRHPYSFFLSFVQNNTYTDTHHKNKPMAQYDPPWWPSSPSFELFGDTPSGMQNTFAIGNYNCAFRAAAQCSDECVWLKRRNKCVPQGLWVKNEQGVTFELDTGSSIIALSPSYCSANNLHTTGTVVPEHYGSAPNAKPSPTDFPHTILDVFTHPTCTQESLAGVPKNGGLIGLRPATSQDKVSHSFMDSVPTGDRKISIDKESDTVCVGSACKQVLVERPTVKFVNVGALSLLGYNKEDKKILLDTGSTQTWKMNDEICILGNDDIQKLYIDYDRGEFRYLVNESNIEAACGPDAKAGNWDA